MSDSNSKNRASPINRAARYASSGHADWTNKIYGTKEGMKIAKNAILNSGLALKDLNWGEYQKIVVPFASLWPTVDYKGQRISGFYTWDEDFKITRDELSKQTGNNQAPDPDGTVAAPGSRLELLDQAERIAFEREIPKLIHVDLSPSGSLEFELGWVKDKNGDPTRLVVVMLCPQ